MRRLEQTIGLSRGAIFHHFRDKDTLFFELAREDAERMAEVASREGLIQVMRDMLAAPDQFDWLATRLEIARKLRNDPAFHRAGRNARRNCRRRPPNGCAGRSRRAGCATTCPATCCRAIWTWCSTDWWPGWPPATIPSRLSGRARPGRGVGAAAAERQLISAAVRWLGPPRLRMVVPDSRSMLWMDPYDRPVEATSVRMLAPPS